MSVFAVFKHELEETVTLLKQMFDDADYVPPHQKKQNRPPSIPREEFRAALMLPEVGLTPREVNMVMAMAPLDDAGARVLYSGFDTILYEVKLVTQKVILSEVSGLLTNSGVFVFSNSQRTNPTTMSISSFWTSLEPSS